MQELFDLASAMGVEVRWEDFLPAGWFGAYSVLGHCIYLLRGMSLPRARVVFAHELGHAFYRHTGSSEANEWHADKWAAEQLVNPLQYLAARQGSAGIDDVAEKLGVTPHLVSVYMRCSRSVSMFMEYQPFKARLLPPTTREACGLAA